MESGEPLTLPDGYPQEEQIVVEQLKILKSLGGSSSGSNLLVKKDNVSLATVIASGSSSSNSTYQKIKKATTSFVSNSDPNYSSNRTTGLTMLEKLKLAEPYNLFFTRIPESAETLKQQESIAITGWSFLTDFK